MAPDHSRSVAGGQPHPSPRERDVQHHPAWCTASEAMLQTLARPAAEAGTAGSIDTINTFLHDSLMELPPACATSSSSPPCACSPVLSRSTSEMFRPVGAPRVAPHLDVPDRAAARPRQCRNRAGPARPRKSGAARAGPALLRPGHPAQPSLRLPVEPPMQVADLGGQIRDRPDDRDAGDDLSDGDRPHRRLRKTHVGKPASCCDECTYTIRPSPTHPCAAEHIGQCSPEVKTVACARSSTDMFSAAQRASANSGCLVRSPVDTTRLWSWLRRVPSPAASTEPNGSSPDARASSASSTQRRRCPQSDSVSSRSPMLCLLWPPLPWAQLDRRVGRWPAMLPHWRCSRRRWPPLSTSCGPLTPVNGQ